MIDKLKGIVCQPDEPVPIDAMNVAIDTAGSDMSAHQLRFRRINPHGFDTDLLTRSSVCAQHPWAGLCGG
jgi:hypothetical protein